VTDVVRATNLDDLTRVNELLHDRWFDLADVTFQEGDSSLTIEFSDSAGDDIDGGDRLMLAIHHVESYCVEDTQRIGRYDFNVIRYDASQRTVTVLTGIPCVLWAVVRRLDIVVNSGKT